MINIKFKKIISKILLSVMLCGALTFSRPAFATEYSSLYNLVETTKLSSGVTYQNIKKLTSQGWMNINVVRADLTDEYTQTKPLYNTNGVSIKEPLSSMMSQSNALAGINGDFFIMQSPTQSYGPIISNGQIISSPYPSYENYPTLSVMNDGSIDISVWNPTIYVKNSQGKAVYTPLINKAASIKYNPVLLNEYYGAKTPGNTLGDIVEIVIKDNKVIDIRENQAPVTIPKGGYVIACGSSQKQTIKSLFKVGEKVDVTIKLDFDLDKIDWAAGGVNYLVKNGQVNDIHMGVLGKQPRSAVGFNKDNTEIMFVTVDGRNKDYVGVTQTELAKIMIELGAYNVLNLDGGGSTTMGVDFLKDGNIEIVNYPSDGQQRPIASGLGIFSTAPNDDTVDSLEFNLDYNKAFVNNEIELNVKAFNKYYSEVQLDNNKVVYSVDSSKGTIVNNKFKPSTTGVTTVTAKYGDKTITTDITVLDKPVSLNFENDNILLNANETYEFKNIVGTDKDGNTAYISPENIQFSIRNGVGTIKDGIFTANDTVNTGAITAICGDAVKNITMKVGYKAVTVESFEKADNMTFSTYPANSNGGIEITDMYRKEQYNSLKLSYDFSNMTDQSIAYVNFGKNNEGIKLKDEPLGVGMWVYGDESNHWLRATVQDAWGREYKVDFASEVNWKGWQFVTAKLPSDVTYPVKVKNVYLAEINETRKDNGTIYIDGLRALYEPNDKNLNLLAETTFTDSMNVTSEKSFIQKLTVTNGKSTLSQTTDKTVANPIYLDVTINNGTIDYTNVALWNKMKALADNKNQNIVLSFNKSLNYITDKKEKECIDNIINDIAKNNKVFVIWKGDNSTTSINEGIRYIEYKTTFELYVNKDKVTYKN